MDSIAINTGNASEELGKAEELLRIYKKANTGAKNKLGGGGELSLGGFLPDI
jgi:hypothetical protein